MAVLDLNYWVSQFLGRMAPELGSECIRWTGSRNVKNHYGQCRIPFLFDDRWTISAKKVTQAHRMSYTIFRGAIPHGRHLDHLCNHKWCVNPYHLEVVTQKENTFRAHCVQYGYEYEDAFTGTDSGPVL